MHEQGRRKPALLFPEYRMVAAGAVVAPSVTIRRLRRIEAADSGTMQAP